MTAPTARLEALLGVPIVAVGEVGRGPTGTLSRARSATGAEYFVKAATAHRDSGGALTAEVAGLRWLGQVAPAGLIPEVWSDGHGLLVLPWLTETAPTAAAADRFGRELAALHTASPGRFGGGWPGWIATVPQDNTIDPGEWGDWYARRRLAPLLPAAAPRLGARGVALLDRVVAEIDRLAGPPEPPGRIHGDLWSGNVLWTESGVRLVDPAAHGGHRETDLAMLALFGAPRLDRILAAYREVAPLADGWQRRVPLHQLYPLLVHVVLFGGSYAARTVAAAEAVLGE
ncbi:fructosamine kinase family protein [Nocardia sp. alder85J]|uniref:fructosamine kinase family protein n=1 Tax=Nocardia sp. alder85J TaxID=2862949 RepID=UPI001CD4FD7E|nr:fructosamine kinase family protein [Nocardia sp. alder85J]MCX4092856.1 fructosamine kinase family protein [Nocardia sp. alder85J]